jgi:hypothetical protein
MSAAAEARAWLAALGSDPGIHLHAFDLPQRAALLVRLDEAQVRGVSFLDDRALTPDTPGLIVPLDAALDAALALEPQPFDALFHVGHCGSTLVSRLIASLPSNLPRREPLWWLDVGTTRRELGKSLTPRAWDALWSAGRRALARRFVATDRVLLKSTSLASNLLTPLLADEPEARALLLTTDLETWLATMLRKPGTRATVEQNLAYWLPDLQRVHPDTPLRAAELRLGERAAVIWLAPMLAFEAALRESPQRVKLLRFEDVLAMPRVALAAVSSHLGLGASAANISAVLEGPGLSAYAKDPARPYDAATRRAELDAARREHAEEIRAGLAFAARYAADSPLIAAHLRG